jgi:hypothetical protein
MKPLKYGAFTKNACNNLQAEYQVRRGEKENGYDHCKTHKPS